jgi:acyl transferase domain-containing protein
MNLDELQAAVAGCAYKLQDAAKNPANRAELIEASHAYANTLQELQTRCDHADVKTEVVETGRFRSSP